MRAARYIIAFLKLEYPGKNGLLRTNPFAFDLKIIIVFIYAA
jgi:hypothetical protein